MEIHSTTRLCNSTRIMRRGHIAPLGFVKYLKYDDTSSIHQNQSYVVTVTQKSKLFLLAAFFTPCFLLCYNVCNIFFCLLVKARFVMRFDIFDDLKFLLRVHIRRRDPGG